MSTGDQSARPDVPAAPPLRPVARSRRRWFVLRQPIGAVSAVVLGLAGVACCFLVWWYLTRGERSEDRIVAASLLPSPAETFGTFKQLWYPPEGEMAAGRGMNNPLIQNVFVTLWRVGLGFCLAAIVGIPFGVLCGCFPPLGALLTPLLIFGRNIPIAALIPLTFYIFGIGESQKIMFIFLACVAFVISDTATAIASVPQSFVDTAYTLGATRWQVIIKTLVPLALPKVFDSLRLLFGLAFGYIMLAETIQMGSEAGGLGNLILKAQRRARPEQIYMIILIIPLIALAMDRLLFLVQRQLFPFRYGGAGVLLQAVQGLLQIWESLKSLVIRVKPPFDQIVAQWKAQQPVSSTEQAAADEGPTDQPSKTEWRP